MAHFFLLFFFLLCIEPSNSALPSHKISKYEGSSDIVKLDYYVGPVSTAIVGINIIWYGKWGVSEKNIITAFLESVSTSAEHPSVKEWWSTLQLYNDLTGFNITKNVYVSGEINDHYSLGISISRSHMPKIIKRAISLPNHSLPISATNLYLILTSSDVFVETFCMQVCGLHTFTFPSQTGHVLPFAWIGNSAKQCPGLCAYPFAVSPYMGDFKPLQPPNGNVGVDGMISVIAHELAEMTSNPLSNSWYCGTQEFPIEIADLCEGIYGTGGGGSFLGSILKNQNGASYNVNGKNGRKFLVQWLWNRFTNECTGPNALDK